MDMLWPILGIATVAIGLAGVVLPLLPGMPLVFGGLWLLAWSDGFARVGETTVVVLGVLALIAWAIDYVAAIVGVKRVGASGLAITGAAIGTVLGLTAGLVGVLIGPVIGAIAGEWLARRNGAQASRGGWHKFPARHRREDRHRFHDGRDLRRRLAGLIRRPWQGRLGLWRQG